MNDADRDEQLARRARQIALDVVAAAGVRLIELEGALVAGIWSDLDGPHVRRALQALGHAPGAVCYLDGPDVPLRYKLRRGKGQPVPASGEQVQNARIEQSKNANS